MEEVLHAGALAAFTKALLVAKDFGQWRERPGWPARENEGVKANSDVGLA